MDEKEYKSTYNLINPQRCVFEKAINSRICNCSKSQRFNLADREGVACRQSYSLKRCNEFILQLRTKAKFVLKKLEINKPLGHMQEIKIQNGGLIGLQKQLLSNSSHTVEDIDALITEAEKLYRKIDNYPYSEIMQIISAYKIRNRCKQSSK